MFERLVGMNDLLFCCMFVGGTYPAGCMLYLPPRRSSSSCTRRGGPNSTYSPRSPETWNASTFCKRLLHNLYFKHDWMRIFRHNCDKPLTANCILYPIGFYTKYDHFWMHKTSNLCFRLYFAQLLGLLVLPLLTSIQSPMAGYITQWTAILNCCFGLANLYMRHYTVSAVIAD